ncbi:MAG: TIGR04283 family arsenosugar biosynthesis glycosyltransferase [Jaaginema sp. PMC 1079.18]|nr:TIGR04283 family arsenosugar biosynthesis glycosyltransferase [Jaaginema sp. PMC 1080.18]MEC4850524.1 TIGR04283 family arsenosugar biosynthesis glycosyltransferase [Jaaginema sp. PMC 1079.18]MEC4865780.1 TIGR04283 family arsenosugar biosynthesis glycosyltransferase [Jaaginema sp. PMC 1078.18]
MTVATISIIIPTLNEATQIATTLHAAQRAEGVEIIIVDGGSQDNTVECARGFGVTVFTSPQPGRAAQMNFGAQRAMGEILLFLHGDTRLPGGYDVLIRELLLSKKAIAGAFLLAIEGTQPGLRWVEKMVSWRSRFWQFPYGDQALFLTAQTFRDLGGFPDLPIMEDFELIRRLKKQGKIAIAPVAVLTSARRWQKLGIVKTTLINQLIVSGYFLGISPHKLRAWYRRQK